MFSTSFQRLGITFFQRLKDVICPLGKLTRKLATLVFSIEELAQSRGQGFGEVKKGDIRTVVKNSTKIECSKGKDLFSNLLMLFYKILYDEKVIFITLIINIVNTIITKCQIWAILLRCNRISLYPSSFQM